MIETKRFFLRKLLVSDVNNNYLKWFKDQAAKKYIKNIPKNLKGLEKYILSKKRKKNIFFFGIFNKSDHIGNVNIHDIDYKKNQAWVGIFIGNINYRDLGVAQEVLSEVKKFLAKKKIYFLYLNVAKKNYAALKTYKKLNFKIIKNYKTYYKMRCSFYDKNLILGTAQFNSNYGVTNFKKTKINKITEGKIIKLFDHSEMIELDTSNNYPLNLKLLKKIKKFFLLNTKIMTDDVNNISQVNKQILKFKEIKNLKINVVFVHDGDKILTNNGRKILNYLYNLKKKGLIQKVGISFHNFEIIHKVIKIFKIDVIQIPLSIVDQRAVKYFNLFKRFNIIVQVRSIFLQGALLTKVRSNKNLCKIYDKFNQIRSEIDKIRVILSFAFKNEYIDKVIVGVRSDYELKKIINLDHFYNNHAMFKKLKTDDQFVINPLNWNELIFHER